MLNFDVKCSYLGTLAYKNGDKLTCMWTWNQMNYGLSDLQYNNGNTRMGYGLGEMQHVNGDHYKGQWQNGAVSFVYVSLCCI